MLSRIKQARKRIEGLRIALLGLTSLGLNPAEIDAALPGLQDASDCLRLAEQELRQGAIPSHAAVVELKLLKNDLRVNARLIVQGRAFCAQWARMLGAGPSYTAQGEVVLESRGSLSLQG